MRLQAREGELAKASELEPGRERVLVQVRESQELMGLGQENLR